MTGDPMDVACDYCKEPAGQPCRRMDTGRPMGFYHADREKAFKETVAATPSAPEELQAVSQPDRYAALAARYRQALAQALRQTANPTTAGQLERVSVMDPERDRLAWRIHDMADPRALGVAHRAATGLPSVWSGEMQLEELEGLVQELEDLYPPETSA